MIRINCPTCESPIDFATGKCGSGHSYSQNGSTWCMLEPGFKSILDPYLETLEAIRDDEGDYPSTGTDFPLLPHGPLSKRNSSWQVRQQSLAILSGALKNIPPSTIVEIGAWNGWLTHHIALWGHEVCAADYFIHHLDGLNASEWYDENWISVQADLRNPAFIGQEVDVIIFNHCLEYLPETHKLLEAYASKLKPGGMIILLGLPVYANPLRKEKELASFKAYYRDEYQFNIFLFEARRYFTVSDIKDLKSMDYQLRLYPNRKIRNWKRYFRGTSRKYYWGVFSKKS